MVNVYPLDLGSSLSVPGSGAGPGSSPSPNSRPPKLRTKQDSVLGNILGPAFQLNVPTNDSLDEGNSMPEE